MRVGGQLPLFITMNIIIIVMNKLILIMNFIKKNIEILTSRNWISLLPNPKYYTYYCKVL